MIPRSANDAVDSLILVWVRIVVAIAIYCWADSFLRNDQYLAIFVEPRFLFKYEPFQWVQRWTADGMWWHFAITKIAAVGLVFGLLSRVCAATLCFSIAYVLLVERQIYVNHYYLLSLTAGLLVFLPVGGRWSLDAWWGIQRRRRSFPRWQLWLLRFQLGLPYFYGAIAKLNGDWFRGQPGELILRTRFEVGGRPISELPGVVQGFAYSGFAYDLLVVPMLLWRPTRWLAVALSLVFHLTNAATLNIGVFPWFMLATMVVFFPPDTLGRRLRLFVGAKPVDPEVVRSCSSNAVRLNPSPRWATSLAWMYVIVHLLLPLRAAIYPGDSNWNERGHRFGWRMMLRHKDALTHYLVVDQNSDEFLFVPSTIVLTGYQAQRADHHPELIRQTAVAISEAAAELGVPQNRVYALALVSLNGRKPVPMVDPNVDLTQVRRGWWRDDWVQDDPGPFRDKAWDVPKDRWWSELDLPEPFVPLQGRSPTELERFLKQLSNERPDQDAK
ncbi:Vitamin K-dependent gamma-carboxylase [Rubripirellula lacrimiformis]|uniref:Vitamin K-dependent gamma-carboxylase n=2 Tax=Rubripirellula lacrimiformis TaxID=1930273 RepID=A0A517N7S5_9BACT|nr:Vitamin K-dependent gamma-carboxylase [Rubripirellula lacrimiformis]